MCGRAPGTGHPAPSTRHRAPVFTSISHQFHSLTSHEFHIFPARSAAIFFTHNTPDNLGTTPGQLPPESGQLRDNPGTTPAGVGTTPGQPRDNPGTTPAGVGAGAGAGAAQTSSGTPATPENLARTQLRLASPARTHGTHDTNRNRNRFPG